MKWYSEPRISFRRHSDRIEPMSKSCIERGSVVFYEIPVKSVNHFTIDIIRYTMKCVYSGEVLFPCSFNTNINEDTEVNIKSRVFFDAVFTNGFRRNVTDKLALSLMNSCRSPFLYKAVGAFSEDESGFNCARGTFLNGETFLVTTRHIKEGEVLICSPVEIVTPHPNDTPESQWEALSRVGIKNSGLLEIILGVRDAAIAIRPEGEVVEISNTVYPDLQEKVRRYGTSRKLGLLEIREKVVRSRYENLDPSKKEDDKELLRVMEEKYTEILEKFGDGDYETSEHTFL